MSLACMYCKHYKYDSDLSRIFWKVTQNSECLQLGRCIYNDKKFGNAVLSTGWQSDGVIGCDNFEDTRNTLKYSVGDVFESSDGVFGITNIQFEYFPRIYRCSGIMGGGWSQTEEELDEFKLIWKAKDHEQKK